MLYENEYYDAELGSAIPVSKLEREEERVIKLGDDMQALKDSPGFKELESFMKQKIDRYMKALVYEDDREKILRLQEAIKVFQGILNYVDALIIERDNLLQERPRNKGGK